MASDDYNRVVFSILTYLFSCFSGKTVFNELEFYTILGKHDMNDVYFHNLLCSIADEGLIEGIHYKKAWGGQKIIISDIKDIAITYKGIHYLKEDKEMNKVADYFLTNPELITGMVKMIFGK